MGVFVLNLRQPQFWKQTVLETEAENIGNSLNNHRVRPYTEQDYQLRHSG